MTTPEPSQGGVVGTMGNALRPPAISYRRRSRTNGPTPTPRAGPAPRAPHEGAPVAAPNEDHPQETLPAATQRPTADAAFKTGPLGMGGTPGPRDQGLLVAWRWADLPKFIRGNSGSPPWCPEASRWRGGTGRSGPRSSARTHDGRVRNQRHAGVGALKP